MSVIGSIINGIIGSGAASKAANAGVQGAQAAQTLEQQNQTNALNTQAGVSNTTTAAEQPYQQLGQNATSALESQLGNFKAPTLAQAQQTPGYQFALQQGTQAIDENAAANGTLMSGNTGTALQQFGQGLATTSYQQDYNNALSTYQANVNPLLQASNLGLQSTGQVGAFGQQAANTTANIDLTGAQQQAQQINNAAAARASGYLGSAAATEGAISGAFGDVGGGLAAGTNLPGWATIALGA